VALSIETVLCSVAIPIRLWLRKLHELNSFKFLSQDASWGCADHRKAGAGWVGRDYFDDNRIEALQQQCLPTTMSSNEDADDFEQAKQLVQNVVWDSSDQEEDLHSQRTLPSGTRNEEQKWARDFARLFEPMSGLE
jgi:hypothetical protein